MGRGGPDALIAAARAGDHEAWRELYLRHARRLTIWLRSLPSVDTASSPEDIASEAWLTAASRIAQFSGGDDDFGGWLFTIARNHASNARRTGLRRRTQPVAVEASTHALFGSVHDDLDQGESQARTRELLSHLSPREAQVVACIDVVGLDVAATAAALGMTATAVRVARHRGLGRLHRILLDEEGPPAARLSTSP